MYKCKKSNINYNYGGSNRKIKKSGQVNVLATIEPVVKSKREIVSISGCAMKQKTRYKKQK